MRPMLNNAHETIAHLIGPAAIDPAPLLIPVGAAAARAGFPSPAEDLQDDTIDLNDMLVRNPLATFLYRAEGWSMLHAGICDGDLLVVDRSVTPIDGDLVIATWEGNQPACKVLKVCADHLELHSRNPHFPPIVLAPGTEAEIFAVVSVARQIHRGRHRVRSG